jgi:hypothetical protein
MPTQLGFERRATAFARAALARDTVAASRQLEPG